MADETPDKQPDERRSINDNWWWSPALMLIVGLGVIGYQSTPILAGEAIVLNWVMVVIGAVVAVLGLMQLKTAYAAHRAQEDAAQDARADEGRALGSGSPDEP